MYTDFAYVYDKLMEDVDYKTWAQYYINLMQMHNVNGENLVECACGTGSLSQYFAEHYNTIGIDISPQMLEIAAQKARQNGFRIMFSNQNMQNFKIHKQVDFVISSCDGVNYLLNKKEVLNFFKSAHKALISGGALLFDVSTPYKLKEILPSQTWAIDGENLSYIWNNEYIKNTLNLNLSIFIKQNDESYKRINEYQKQTCFTIDEYENLLVEAGFCDIKVYGDKSFNAPTATEHRWHFIAKSL